MLTIWWCPFEESSLVLLEEGVCYDLRVIAESESLSKTLSLWPASLCTPRPNLPVTSGISWLPTFAFQSPIMKKTSFWVLVLKGLVGLHRTIQLQLLHHYWLGPKLGLLWDWMVCLGKWTEIILLFLRLHPSPALQTLLLILMATPFLLRDSCPQ